MKVDFGTNHVQQNPHPLHINIAGGDERKAFQ